MKLVSILLFVIIFLACKQPQKFNEAERAIPQNKSGVFYDASPHLHAFADVNGITLHFLDWGGSGVPIILLPGLGNNAHMFDDLAPKLTDKFHVYGLTLRGHGQSDSPPNGYDPYTTLVEDLKQFMDLIGIKEANMAGFSMGGFLINGFASKYPDRIKKAIFIDGMFDWAFYNEPAPRERDSAWMLDSGYFKNRNTYKEGYWRYAEGGGNLTNATLADMHFQIKQSPEGVYNYFPYPLIEKTYYKNIAGHETDFSHITMPALGIFTYGDDGINPSKRKYLSAYVAYNDSLRRLTAEKFKAQAKQPTAVFIQSAHPVLQQKFDSVYYYIRKFLYE